MKSPIPLLALVLALAPLAGRAAASSDPPGDAPTPPAAESQDVRRVEVLVTAVSSRNVYLDQGAEAGLEPGDRVTLFPTGGATVEAEIEVVTKVSARARLLVETSALQVGDRGEVLVPLSRFGAGGAGAPEHPPWESAEGEFDQNRPLLADVPVQKPEDREREWHGRVFGQFDWLSDNRPAGATNQLWRTGVDLRGTNPFGRGGSFRFDGEFYRRTTDRPDGPKLSTDRFRLDRLSYAWGGDRYAPRRWEIGRFLHREFPELGVLDGVDLAQRLGDGALVGASVGFLPEPFPDMQTGKDFQTSLYYRRFLGEDDRLQLGGAYQKSWHEGAADRDLFIGTLDYSPDREFSAYASAWVDYYTAGDEIKGSGFELTELHAGARWRPTLETGYGVSVTQIRFPELARNEFQPLTAMELADNHVRRVGVDGYTEVGDKRRLSGRVDAWEDEDQSGYGGNVRYGLRDWLVDRGEVAFSLFFDDGQFSSVLGARIDAWSFRESGNWRWTYEASRHENTDFSGVDDTLLQHLVRGSWDRDLGKDWSLSLSGDVRFGDEQDSYSLGIFLQRRF